MPLKIVIESEDSEEESYPCPKCGEDCEMDDKYCCQCGAKMPLKQEGPAAARMAAMKNMIGDD